MAVAATIMCHSEVAPVCLSLASKENHNRQYNEQHASIMPVVGGPMYQQQPAAKNVPTTRSNYLHTILEL